MGLMDYVTSEERVTFNKNNKRSTIFCMAVLIIIIPFVIAMSGGF